jgi:steroid 5-alpha reductase family enzyme
MNSVVFLLAVNLATALAYMVFLWPVSLVKKDASIADIFWGLGFVIIAWLTLVLTDGYVGRKLLLVFLTSVWGFRLSLHIFLRHRGKGEDPRYVAMRESHGKQFWWYSLFSVFGLQAILLWLVSLPLQLGQMSPVPNTMTWLDALGTGLWALGFSFEAVSDWQLSRFLANPQNKGKIMRQGLWAYSRHPNYFGESLIWWGIYIITLAAPGTAWGVIGPATITFLLLRVSGVPMLEKSMLAERPEYKAYLEETSAFFPWFPKKTRRVS